MPDGLDTVEVTEPTAAPFLHGCHLVRGAFGTANETNPTGIDSAPAHEAREAAFEGSGANSVSVGQSCSKTAHG